MWPFRRRPKRPYWVRDYENGQRTFADLLGSYENLDGLELSNAKFDMCMFNSSTLRHAKFSQCIFKNCTFVESDLSEATIEHCVMMGCKFTQTKFHNAVIFGSKLDFSIFGKADFTGATLGDVSFRDAQLIQCDFTNAPVAMAHFEGCLQATRSHVLRNRDVFPAGASDQDMEKFFHNRFDNQTLNRTIELHAERFANISQWTKSGARQSSGASLYASLDGLRDFLALTGMQPHAVKGIVRQIQLAPGSISLFISYASADLPVAEALHAWLSRRGYRVWFAPREMESGATIKSQLMSVIEEIDGIVVILSPNSFKSDWVRTEIIAGVRQERRRARPIVFPVRLVDYSELTNWSAFDEQTKTDCARELSQRFIPDFTKWSSPDAFDDAVSSLVKSIGDAIPSDERTRAEREDDEERQAFSSFAFGEWCTVRSEGENVYQKCKMCGATDQVERGLRVARECPDCGLTRDPGRAVPWFRINRGLPEVTVTCERQGHQMQYDYADGPPLRCPRCLGPS